MLKKERNLLRVMASKIFEWHWKKSYELKSRVIKKKHLNFNVFFRVSSFYRDKKSEKINPSNFQYSSIKSISSKNKRKQLKKETRKEMKRKFLRNKKKKFMLEKIVFFRYVEHRAMLNESQGCAETIFNYLHGEEKKKQKIIS